MRNVWAYGFIFLFTVFLASCENDVSEVNAVTKKDSFPMLTTQNVDMMYSDSARLKVHLTAPLLEDYGDVSRKQIFPEGVHLDFYNDSGKVNGSLKADYAENREKEEFMIAKKNVVVVNVKGEQLNTEKLMWDKKRHKIYTDAFVKITTADQVLMGNGMEADEMFVNYEIKDITGTILLNK